MNNLLEELNQTVLNNTTRQDVIRALQESKLHTNSDIYKDSNPKESSSDFEELLKELGD